jgi:hypothetical protein
MFVNACRGTVRTLAHPRAPFLNDGQALYQRAIALEKRAQRFALLTRQMRQAAHQSVEYGRKLLAVHGGALRLLYLR